MTRYQQCLQVVLGHEGGLSDVREDRGGRTNYGITQQTYSDFLARRGRGDRRVDGITSAEVEEIYREYWVNAKCDYCPEPLDLLIFDSAVNHGGKRAIKLLQRALGIGDDGVFGPQTITAINEEALAGNIPSICLQYLDERRDFYDRIIENDPTQRKFERGWSNRVDHLEELIA